MTITVKNGTAWSKRATVSLEVTIETFFNLPRRDRR